MTGHLFVARGSLTSLACDAILVPSGTRDGSFGDVSDRWSSLALPRDEDGFVTPSPDGQQRAVQVLAGEELIPSIWVGHTGETGREPPEWYADAITQFVRDAGCRPPVSNARPLGDARPLLGVPLVGTGEGGMRERRGEVVLAAVRAIAEELERVNADVVLVLDTAEAYASAQQARSRVFGTSWPALARDLEEIGRELAVEARRDRLVLFLGAGVSVGAGLPTWSRLISRLGDEAEMTGESERAELHALDSRDAGVVIDQRLRRQGRSLVDVIHGLVATTRVSLPHQLLASLPVKEVVTTNYDVLFEQAWRDAGRPHAVLPAQTARDASSWLLKLHGSIDDPARIVLSRDDYLRFEGEGVALAGIVQAMLLTRHMLFVGYSLSDDNFHRLVHQVRGALGEASDRLRGRFGTALTPTPPRLSQDIWGDDVRFVSTAGDSDEDVRRLAILLDYIGLEASAPAAHVLDDSYRAVFSADELKLRERLREVRLAAAAPGVRPAVRRAMEEALDVLRG